jgi:hypothetical protein
MTSTTSQASAPSIDLYDQDRYSIPDDELSSGGSSTISSADEATDASMDTDATSSPTSPKNMKTLAKKQKFTKQSLERVFDPHVHDLDSLHGQRMDEETKACQKVCDEIQSDTTTSSYRRRVPLTTLATAEDFNFGASTKQNTTKVPNTGNHVTASREENSNLKQKKLGTDAKHSGDTMAKVTFANSPPVIANISHVSGNMVNITNKSQSQFLPSTQNDSSTNPVTFYTYRAQLTFGLSRTTDGVNVAKYFRRWIFSSCESIDHFSLIPYDDEKGQQITSLDQVPEDNADFYSMYYHNHRVLIHGNLTGMVSFQSSLPWAKLKSPNHPFFNWLRLNKVFLNQTKFKASSLVPCGFLLGAHPGHLRRDEAEAELRISLGYSDGDELPFQLSSRSVSVPIQEGKLDRYVFQAVVIETSTQHAASLREKFFSLGDPKKTVDRFPYTGSYQFVPFLKTKEWTVAKILNLAKLHVKMVQELKPIFIANLRNIHNDIAKEGITLLQGFYGMQYTYPAVEGKPAQTEPLLHSIHNTAKPNTKVALVSLTHYEAAITQLSAIHSILASYISPEYHDRVFIDSLQAGIIGQQIDSISSCNSAAYAMELLHKYNPQDGEDLEAVTPIKRFRHVPMSYATAAMKDSPTTPATDGSKETVSSVTSADLDNLFDKMKQYIAGNSNPIGINIDELEAKVSQSAHEVQTVREQLCRSVKDLGTRVDNLSEELKLNNSRLSEEIQRQNVIILGMQRQFQDTMTDFSNKLQEIYSISEKSSPSISPTASTSKTRHWGESAP